MTESVALPDMQNPVAPSAEVDNAAPEWRLRMRRFIWADLQDADDDIRVERAKVLVGQTTSGEVLGLAMATAYSFFYVPAAGLGQYLIWLLILVLGFETRRILCRRLLPVTPANADQLLKIAAMTTWMLSLVITAPALMWLGKMSESQQAVVLSFQLMWVVTVVTIIGITPRTYQIYLLLSLLPIVGGAWIWMRGNPILTVITMAVTFGGVVVWRMAALLGKSISDTVTARSQNNALVARLEVALAQASELQAARSRFLASASHDLLQPIQTLLLLVPMVKSTADTERRSELGQQLTATVVSIDGMFRGFLEFARLEVGAITPKLSTVDMRLVVKRVADTLQPRCDAKGLALHVRLPDTAQLAKVDVVLIDRVLQNIADNAVKYTQSGSVSLEIRPNALDPTAFDLCVEDSGVGISKLDEGEVGKPFFRGSASISQDVPGTGLGLANSYLLLGMMSGSLKLQQALGGGCMAIVTLAKDWAAAMPSVLTVAEPQYPVKYKRIALLEDDAGVRKALTLLLQIQHCEVVSGSTGAALRAQFDLGFIPDFMIADYSLADGETGVEALEDAMKRFTNLPTALVSGSVIDPGLLPDGVSWLAKPVDHTQLLKLLSDRSEA